MADVKINVGKYEVIYSGTFHVADCQVDLVFEGVKLEVVFKNDGGEPRYTSTVKNDGFGVLLELNNFNNAFGEGKLDPIPFVISNGHEVKLTFFVHTLDKEKNLRSLTLTLLKAPEKNV